MLAIPLIKDSIPWKHTHSTVWFQKQRALLNSSYMGGTLNLIINDDDALKSARIFSENNKKEILWQAGNKFVIGIVGGLTGGGTVVGVVLTIGFDIYFEDSKSNQNSSFGGDVVNSAKESGAGIAIDVVKSGANMYGAALNAPGSIWRVNRCGYRWSHCWFCDRPVFK